MNDKWNFNQLMGNWWHITATIIVIVSRRGYKNYEWKAWERPARGEPFESKDGFADAEEGKAAAIKWLEQHTAKEPASGD